MNSKDTFKQLDDFFRQPPSIDQKAWDVIHDFYHQILIYMEENGITKAELSRRLHKSRSFVTQMFNKTPNVSIKKMVEIADAIGLEINISAIPDKVVQKITDQISLNYTTYFFNVLDEYSTATIRLHNQRYKPIKASEFNADVYAEESYN